MTLSPKTTTIAKIATQVVATCTTYSVAKAVIKNNVAEPETFAQKATLAAGSILIADLVSAKVATHAMSYVDTIAEMFNSTSEAVKNSQQ